MNINININGDQSTTVLHSAVNLIVAISYTPEVATANKSMSSPKKAPAMRPTPSGGLREEESS